MSFSFVKAAKYLRFLDAPFFNWGLIDKGLLAYLKLW